jgi:hypothetical protein
MLRKLSLVLAVVVVALLAVVPVFAGAPNFGAGLWADGEQWGTKVTTALPGTAPEHSFDKFFFIVDGNGDQVGAVMEAAPGNPDYNGGRWVTFKVTIVDPDGVSLPVKSYEQLMHEVTEGDVIVSDEPVLDGVHPLYFQCPLLPYKP